TPLPYARFSGGCLSPATSPLAGGRNMKPGIIGLSSVGKSTLFQLLTGAPAAPPTGRPEPRLAIARVPDPRVDALAEMYQPKKKTYAPVQYVDAPRGAKGE